MKRRHIFFSLIVVLFSVVLVASSRPVFAANPYCGGLVELGRQGCHGYFSDYDYYKTYIVGSNVLNVPGGAAWSIPKAVNNAATFESLIAGYLGGGTSWLGNAASVNRVGAAFIVDAMLGTDGNTASGGATNNPGNGIRYAQAHLQQWEDAVTYDGAQGWVNWGNAGNNWNDTQYQGINTLHTCWPGIPAAQCTLPNEDNGSDDGHDIAFFNMQAPEDSHVIYFRDASGKILVRIRRECANLLGSINGIPLAPPPATANPHCGADAVTPDRLDPNTQYSVSSRVWYDDAAQTTQVLASNDKFFIKVTGPGGYSYTNNNVPQTRIGQDTIEGDVTPGTTGRTGTFDVSYGMTGSLAPITCSDSFVVADLPYFSVTGGDIEAGGGMTVEQPSGGTVCTAEDDKAGVVSWNREAAGNYAGAGTEYAASVLNYLQDFATAQGSATNPAAPSGLAFSNTDNVSGNDLFGGGFGAESCVPDYFANATGVQNGNVTVGGRAVANGTHTTVYVKGNVYITGNITYSGLYANVQAIPSYSVIVEGNIYIAAGVSRLDGLYVAEPTVAGTGGVIYTCATGFSALGLDSGLYNTCKDSSLTVNGSFVANQVWLLRTGGSLGTNSSAAETFNFSPEVWLTTPPAAGAAGGSTGSYDAITSLPPVL